VCDFSRRRFERARAPWAAITAPLLLLLLLLLLSPRSEKRNVERSACTHARRCAVVDRVYL